MAIIEAKQLSKYYGKVRALHKVDLSVEAGDIYGFIGPNGAGKTTLIRLLLGILRADAGAAHVFNQDAWHHAVSIHKRIAYVPGDVKLWPNMTGGEVIDILTSFNGHDNSKKKQELIETFDLDPTKKCRSYSKGNRQKVALIAAFASDAELFILDEPTSGLDPLMERLFQEHIQALKAENKTVFLSSHILREVETLCDKVSIIRQGEIIESGALKDLRHLRATEVEIESKHPIADLEKIPSVSNVEKSGCHVRLHIDSAHIGALIKHIASSEVLSFHSTPPTLEQLFMRHYERDE